jgi:tripartite-type tricarboxylate transporter receptor subunit TctC
VVTNIAGAGGRIGSKAVATAAPDGYTVMIGGTNLNVVLPAAFKGLDYDPVKDLAPVGAIATDAMLLAIHPGLPVKTVAEFVQYSKRNPGKVNAGSAPGIGPHYVIELFKLRTGADLAFVPYKGAAPAIQDTLGGHLSMTVTNKAVLLPLIQKNQLRALAVTSTSRLAELPDVPTLKESGGAGHAFYQLVRRDGSCSHTAGTHRQAAIGAARGGQVARGVGRHPQARARTRIRRRLWRGTGRPAARVGRDRQGNANHARVNT